MSNDIKVTPMGKVDLLFKGETVPDVEVGLFEFEVKGVPKRFYSTKDIPEIGVSAKEIRLYPFKGMEDFETVIKPLFEGEKVILKDLPSKKKQGTYSLEAYFETDQKPSFIKEKDRDKVKFFGNLVTDFLND